MKTFVELNQEFYEKKRLEEKAHFEAIRELLKEYGLDGDVISKRTGKRGRLEVDGTVTSMLKFYPYKKDGDLSLKSESWVYEASVEFEKAGDK